MKLRHDSTTPEPLEYAPSPLDELFAEMDELELEDPDFFLAGSTPEFDDYPEIEYENDAF